MRLRDPIFQRALCLILGGLLLLAWGESSARQRADGQQAGDEAPGRERPEPPDRVEVQPRAADQQIAGRLRRILTATEWFQRPAVEVDQGVVFLEGATREERYRDWASELARRTEGVVAVVNRITIVSPVLGDWGPAVEGLHEIWQGLAHALPYLTIGLVVLLLAYGLGRGATAAVRWSSRRRDQLTLIRELGARALGLLFFTLGLYLALRIAGLTRLAATVLGGTGLIGLVLGIAFRDIVENTLASVLLTRQQPFHRGDLVEIGGVEGLVQRLTLRATVLMSLDGNHVQIPNATVYKSTIRNYTSNPTRRIDFCVGIGYEQSIARAQQVALAVLAEHPAVLQQPAPWVLADNLGPAVVTLRIYIWLDGVQHAWLKVRSSVIRQVKAAFQAEGISMPDAEREVLFPEGIALRLVEDEGRPPRAGTPEQRPAAPAEDVSTGAEARLESEVGSVRELGDRSRQPESGEDLLERDPPVERS